MVRMNEIKAIYRKRFNKFNKDLKADIILHIEIMRSNELLEILADVHDMPTNKFTAKLVPFAFGHASLGPYKRTLKAYKDWRKSTDK